MPHVVMFSTRTMTLMIETSCEYQEIYPILAMDLIEMMCPSLLNLSLKNLVVFGSASRLCSQRPMSLAVRAAAQERDNSDEVS